MPADHLTPDDVERLLDGEEFPVLAARVEHARTCPDCAGVLEEAEQVLAALDALGELAPSAGFADRVMADVRIFEPWHVAIGRTVAPWIPSSGRRQLAAAMAAVVAGSGLTAGAWWLLARADMAILLAQVGLKDLRTHLLGAGRDLLHLVMGPAGAGPALLDSPSLLGWGIACSLGAMALSLTGLRRLALRWQRDH